MSTLRVSLQERSYEIINEAGLLSKCGGLAGQILHGKKVCLVTDTTVGSLYAETVLESFREAGFAPFLLTVPAGEGSKSPEMLTWLWEQMAEHQMSRADCVAALGGGVVGDLAGFAAATILRGVDFLQLPTTLLAQVDSSVGGKVAVDLKAGKNLAGSFYQPKLVLIDTDTLKTLPDRDFSDGMAEIIKYGCIWDADLFHKLDALGGRPAVMEEIGDITTRCCDIKRRMVEQDEHDLGLRMLLNFGHTFGHVYEKAYHYETYTHGEAVAAGMVDAAKLGEAMGYTVAGTARKIMAILAKYHLPTAIPVTKTDYENTMALDKKSLGEEIRFVFLKQIGLAETIKLSKKELFSHL